jgi:FkbM family methyltransferase
MRHLFKRLKAWLQTQRPPPTSVIASEARQSISPSHLVPFDENLLERSRTQWQFGDWASLAALSRDTLQHHPDRAKLALLAAAGHQGLGNAAEARQHTRLAIDWGCSKKLVTQILISGVHNTLGRAAAVSGQENCAIGHFQTAVQLGVSGNDVRLLTQARINTQKKQLEILTANSKASIISSTVVFTKTAIATKHWLRHEKKEYYETTISLDILENLVIGLLSEDINLKSIALDNAGLCVAKNAMESFPSKMSIVNLNAYGKNIKFIHIAGDYIPKKIEDENKFYENKFLELLGRFYKKDGLIIDCGANIGNHTVYFAKILKANVIAFEPEPHNSTCLEINLALNEISNKVQIHRYALGANSGSAVLRMNIEANFGSFSASKKLNPQSIEVVEENLVNVMVKTLDESLLNYVNSRQAVSIIKIDVEGMELEVLQGASKLIEISLPIIAVECFSQRYLIGIESYLSKYSYFPIEVLNSTPTFLFVTPKNPFHLVSLAEHMRTSLLTKAMKHKGFELG